MTLFMYVLAISAVTAGVGLLLIYSQISYDRYGTFLVPSDNDWLYSAVGRAVLHPFTRWCAIGGGSSMMLLYLDSAVPVRLMGAGLLLSAVAKICHYLPNLRHNSNEAREQRYVILAAAFTLVLVGISTMSAQLVA